MSKIISRRVMPSGTSTRPGTLDLADQGEGLGALALLGAVLGEPVGPVLQDVGDAGQGLDVVDDGRLAPETRDRRERRPGPGHAALSLDRGDQRGLFAADKRAGPFLDLDLEVEPRAQDVLAQQAMRLRLLDRDTQPLQGQRVLGPAVDVAGLGPDGIAGDEHPFQAARGGRPRAASGS